MIGGVGERKTQRLVAKYADACNLFAGPEAAHKLEVLRAHCDREGRDYDEIEKTVTTRFGPQHGAEEVVQQLRGLHDSGFSVVYTSLVGPDPLRVLEMLATNVIPEISTW
jgi:alkanesulfonate monooxygenase